MKEPRNQRQTCKYLIVLQIVISLLQIINKDINYFVLLADWRTRSKSAVNVKNNINHNNNLVFYICNSVNNNNNNNNKVLLVNMVSLLYCSQELNPDSCRYVTKLLEFISYLYAEMIT